LIAGKHSNPRPFNHLTVRPSNFISVLCISQCDLSVFSQFFQIKNFLFFLGPYIWHHCFIEGISFFCPLKGDLITWYGNPILHKKHFCVQPRGYHSRHAPTGPRTHPPGSRSDPGPCDRAPHPSASALHSATTPLFPPLTPPHRQRAFSEKTSLV